MERKCVAELQQSGKVMNVAMFPTQWNLKTAINPPVVCVIYPPNFERSALPDVYLVSISSSNSVGFSYQVPQPMIMGLEGDWKDRGIYFNINRPPISISFDSTQQHMVYVYLEFDKTNIYQLSTPFCFQSRGATTQVISHHAFNVDRFARSFEHYLKINNYNFLYGNLPTTDDLLLFRRIVPQFDIVHYPKVLEWYKTMFQHSLSEELSQNEQNDPSTELSLIKYLEINDEERDIVDQLVRSEKECQLLDEQIKSHTNMIEEKTTDLRKLIKERTKKLYKHSEVTIKYYIQSVLGISLKRESNPIANKSSSVLDLSLANKDWNGLFQEYTIYIQNASKENNHYEEFFKASDSSEDPTSSTMTSSSQSPRSPQSSSSTTTTARISFPRVF